MGEDRKGQTENHEPWGRSFHNENSLFFQHLYLATLPSFLLKSSSVTGVQPSSCYPRTWLFRAKLSFPHNLSFLLDHSNWHSNMSKLASVLKPTSPHHNPMILPLPTAQLFASCHCGNANQSFLFSLPQLSFYLLKPTSIGLTCSA